MVWKFTTTFNPCSNVKTKSLSLFEDDYVSRNMIQQFIVDEQEHYNWVKQHLNLIKEIGYENYLIEQLG